MKQKYFIKKDAVNRQWIVRETAEVDKDLFSVICESSYSLEEINAGLADGQRKLASVIRRPNLYPPQWVAAKIAAAIIELDNSEDGDTREIFVDDIELIAKELKPATMDESEEDEAEPLDIDDLLDDEDMDDDFESDDIDPATYPLKVADDDDLEIED